MLIYIQLLQFLILIIIFFAIHSFLEKKAPKYCEIKPKGNTASDLKVASDMEKGRIKLFMITPATIITVFVLLFFYFSTNLLLKKELSLYYMTEITSIILGISGTIFVAYPTLKAAVTYWEKINSGGKISKKIFEDKGTLINAGFGLVLIFYSFFIKLFYLLQLEI